MAKKINTYNIYCIICSHNKDKQCDILKISCLELKQSDKPCEKWKCKGEIQNDK